MKKQVIGILMLCSLITFSCRSTPQIPEELTWKSVEFNTDESQTHVSLKMSRDSTCVLTGYATQEEDGSWTMNAEDLHWFSNWHSGWTEADLAVSGVLTLTEVHGSWQVRALKPFAIEYTEKADIRYRDSRLTGNAAIDALNRRLSRISAAVEFLYKKLEGRSFSLFTHKNKKVRKDCFEYQAGSQLFPEQYGYPEGTKKSPATSETRIRGEGISWDTVYTETHIKEQLREVRNAGTLYRDWEETATLFYYLYTLEN